MKLTNLTNPNKEPVNGDFVQYEYPNGKIVKKTFHSFPQKTEEDLLEDKKYEERHWRNQELFATDYIVPTTDHPKHAAYMTYRQELRDYPSQPDFPNGERPIKP